MFPTDLDIFSSASWSIPLCIQTRASGLPRPASVCAASFSWCGNTRSMPPPWTSKSTPRYCSAMAEHSMCQPGRPGPHGESQLVSSPSLVDLPEREVERVLLAVGALDALALVHLVDVAARQLAVALVRAHAEVHVAAAW